MFTRCAAIVASSLFIALAVVSCAQTPDPVETREQLNAVTEAPETADEREEVDEYSLDSKPEPIVQPLDCNKYLVLTARGTSEPTRGQLLSPVARAISEARPGQVDMLDVDYPADDNVKAGSNQGARIVIDTLNVQAEECPNQQFVLLGYSQGALVMGDALISPELRLIGQQVGEIHSEALSRVIAVVLFADPRFTAGESYNVGDFSEGVSGLLPRAAASLDALQDRMRSYCSKDDFVCQVHGFELNPDGHTVYYKNGMQTDAAAFVISQLEPLLANAEEDPLPQQNVPND